MTRQEFYRMIEEIIESEPNTILGDAKLNDLEAWDSLSVLQVIAAVDKRLGVNLTAQQIVGCVTVDDIINLLSDKIKD